MKNQNWMADERQILLPRNPVPRRSVLLLSVFAHLIVLVLIAVLWRASRVYIVPEKYETAQKISEPAHLSFNPIQPKTTQPHPSPLHAHRKTKQAPAPQNGTAEDGVPTLHERAKRATSAIMLDLKFYQVYGFHPGHDYQLAAQTAGKYPTILAAGLPPRFEQYVVVEVTIDIDGRVAEARIVSGMVNTTIQETLLSAIREFKYRPAKRDGVPIPSQVDVVIHIPT
jgi:TonB family protein